MASRAVRRVRRALSAGSRLHLAGVVATAVAGVLVQFAGDLGPWAIKAAAYAGIISGLLTNLQRGLGLGADASPAAEPAAATEAETPGPGPA